jgi:dTDP-4-amino-4,6-dideoxygalactose transaminase
MILFNDLKSHFRNYSGQINAAIAAIIDKGIFIMGEQLSAFEKEFAAYVGVKYCVGVASGTEAIALSLMALEIGSGDEVITANLTAFPTITGILQSGAQPVVADITIEDGLLDPEFVKSKITAKTKAIVAVHLYGQCCDMDALGTIAKERGLLIVEDAAQAAGATYKGKKAGSIGQCNAFSFYPTKNLGALGDGGAITTDNEELYHRLMQLRNYGQSRRYYHDRAGMNSRLDEIQAAVLRVFLPMLDGWNRRRSDIARYYRTHIKNAACLRHNDYGTPCNHLFVVRHERRDAIMKCMETLGVQTLIHYPLSVNKQKGFPFQKQETFPASDEFAGTILSVPVYPELSDEDGKRVVEALNECSC